MSAGIAHEFKNALATISGYAQMIRSEVHVRVGDTRDSAERILDQTRALTHVVTEFLRFAKPLEICYETVPMQTLVERVAEELRESGPSATSFAKALSWICQATRRLLRQALVNLTRNAAEAARESGAAARRASQSRERSKNWAAGSGSESALRIMARAFPQTTCRKSSFPSTPRNPKAPAWASRWCKKWRCSTAAASKPATAPAEAPSSCCGYLCGRSLRRRYSPPKPPHLNYIQGLSHRCLSGGVAMRRALCYAAIADVCGVRAEQSCQQRTAAKQACAGTPPHRRAPAQATTRRPLPRRRNHWPKQRAKRPRTEERHPKPAKVFTNDNIPNVGRDFSRRRGAPAAAECRAMLRATRKARQGRHESDEDKWLARQIRQTASQARTGQGRLST